MFVVVIEDIDFKNNHFRNCSNVLSSEFSAEGLLKVLESLKGKEESVVITWASTSFLDFSLIKKLNSAPNYDVMFIPNLPDYMEFEIWNVSFLIEKLKTLSTIKKPLRNSMTPLELDESLFFVDIYQPDIRLYRFDLSPDSLKGKMVLEELYKHIDFSKEIPPQILDIIKTKPEIVIGIPTFYMLEVSNKKVGDEPIKRSWNFEFDNLSFKNFKEIFNKLRSTSSEFSVALGVYNEPLFNDDIFKILEFVNSDGLDGVTFIVSTSLPYLDDKLIKFYEDSKGKKGYKSYSRFYIFANLPKLNSNRFNNVINIVDKFKNIDNERIFVRFVRDKESVRYLPEFYERMRGYNVIISRTFDKELIDADNLLPTRVPCYKLQTSLVILPNGDVPLCLNDLGLVNKLGNVFVDDVSNVVLGKAKYYKSHFFGNYEGVCSNCTLWDQYDL